MLDIYKASAGSGKTFALTLAYFRIIFASPLEYRNILAVTFTNKATEEMKSRIINELHRLAEGRQSDYGDQLKQVLGFSDEQLKNRAVLLRTLLLHDYGRLAVTTIDRFFQRMVKSFTRELGIFQGYNVELDYHFVLLKAVERMMQELGKNPELKGWISELMNRNVEEGKSWSIKSKIAELGEELFHENYMLLDARILERFSDRRFLKSYQHFLHDLIGHYEQRQLEYGRQAVGIIQESGLSVSDFKGNKAGCAFYFYKLLNANFEEPTATVRKAADTPEAWYTKTSVYKNQIERLFPRLNDLLKKSLQLFDREYPVYLSACQLTGNLYQLGILNDLYRKVRSYCDEKGVMLLSDTTHLLNLLIAGNDASFLFEKCGNYYKHLMIDEFQDTSSMQWRNFRPLVVNSLAEGCHAMIVGDVKQSIYRWRNGEWSLLAYGVEEQFRRLGVRNVVLGDNWRSAREIVEFNNLFFSTAVALLTEWYAADAGPDDPRSAVIADAYRDLRQNPRKAGKGYVGISFGPEKDEEGAAETIMAGVVETIEGIVRRGGKQKEAVILVRDGKEGGFVADYLMAYNQTAEKPVNFISNDSLYIRSSPCVQLIIAVLKYMVEPYDQINRTAILYLYRIFVRHDKAERLHGIFSGSGEEILDRLGSDFQTDGGSTLSYSLYETTEMIIDRFGLKDCAAEVPYLVAFQDMIYEYETGNSNHIPWFLEWWEKEQGRRVLSTSEGVDAVRILTVHKSKGLEFEYVILPFCHWKLDDVSHGRRIWCRNTRPGFDRLEYAPLNYSPRLAATVFREDYLDEHLKSYIDNLNLLYVAMTRAKTELYLHPYAPKAKKDGSIPKSDIGAFACEVLKLLKEQLPDAETDENGNLHWGTQQMLEQPGRERESLPLALDAYPVWQPGERIRVKYKYRDYVQPEDAGRSAIDEGKLLHEVFKSIRYTEDIPAAVQQIYLSGLIRREEKPAYCAKIAGYLNHPQASEWFGRRWQVVTEKDILFPGGAKARPDRVITAGQEACVIDYKFGASEEAKYLKQVRFYCGTLEKMGLSGVKGYVWYVKLGKVVEVG